MGQHKTNPTAILAKEGKLPPKKKAPSKREVMGYAEYLIAQRIKNSIWDGKQVLKNIEEMDKNNEEQ